MTTPRYRIGNDLTVFWAIQNRDGSPFDMAGMDIRLFVTNERGRKEVTPILTKLPDGTINNVIRWDFKGDDQRVLGIHTLTVEIRESITHREITKDYCEAFALVSRSEMETDEGDANMTIGGDLILSSRLDIYRFEMTDVDVSALKVQLHDLQKMLEEIEQTVQDLDDDTKGTIAELNSQIDSLGNNLDTKVDSESYSADLTSIYNSYQELLNAIQLLNNMWRIDENGNLVTTFNVVSTGEISAGGAPTEEGESSGLGFDDLQWYLDQNKYVKEEDIAQLIPDNIATKDDVEQRIADVIAGAPEALDTLKEIADALNQNQNEIGAIFDAISQKASKEELKAVDDKHSASIAAINTKDSEQDQAIAELKTKDASIESSITEIKGKDEEQDRELESIEDRLAKAEEITALFGEDEDGNVYVKNSKNFYTRGEISAGGAGTAGGGGGGSDVGGGYLDSLYDVELNEIAVDANLSAAEKEAVTESQVIGYDSKGLWVNKKTMYIHHQNESSTDWVIAHGMNKMPNVKVLDSTGELVFGTVTYNGFNEVKIHFSGSFSGKAYLD